MEEQVVIYIDGGSRGNPGLSAVGIYVDIEKPIEISGFIGRKTNNEAEYAALIQALHLAKQKNWRNILIKCDSLLVVNQFKGIFQIKNLNLLKLYEQVCYYLARLGKVEMIHVPREQNKKADRLVNVALDKAEKDGHREDVAFI